MQFFHLFLKRLVGGADECAGRADKLIRIFRDAFQVLEDVLQIVDVDLQ